MFEIANQFPISTFKLNLWVAVQHQNIPLGQPGALRSINGQLFQIPTAYNQLSGSIAYLPRQVLYRARGRGSRVNAIGGNDAEEQARECRLASRHRHHNIFVWAGSTDAVGVSEEVCKILCQGSDLGFRDVSLGVSSFGVEWSVFVGAAVFRVWEWLE